MYQRWLIPSLLPSSHFCRINCSLLCIQYRALSLYFFFLSIKSFSLSLTFVGLLMMLFLFLLSFSLTLCSLSFSASTCQHFLFPKHSLPALLTMHALLYIMATCGGLLQSMPGMCCLGMAGMHGSHWLKCKCLFTFSLQNVFFNPSPCKMLLVLKCLPFPW